MIFTSIKFLIFFIVVYSLYIFFFKTKKDVHYQNLLLVIASYIFYAAWNYKLLSLILFSTIINYLFSLSIYKTKNKKQKKTYLITSITINLGLLFFFKYLNFGIESFNYLMENIGLNAHFSTLSIILPVGISFYTFQIISYTVDTYRDEIKPTNNFVNFALYISFFPQLVAGPIEKASNLLPQITNKRNITRNDISKGIYWITIGYFKKIIIADNMAQYVEYSFQNLESTSGVISLLGLVAFSLQIYGDFAGYSYIALGISKLMGIDLTKNFNRPYLAISPRDFWRRWHISLSFWLRDYLYFSFGGGRVSNFRKYYNLMLTMVLGGLWHGASWNFLLWGWYHGLLLIFEHILRDYRISLPFTLRIYPKVKRVMKIIAMYLLTLIGWLLFRLSDLSMLPLYVKNVFTNFHYTDNCLPIATPIGITFLCLIGLHIIQEIKGNEMIILKQPKEFIYSFYTIMILMIISVSGKTVPFLYFQF